VLRRRRRLPCQPLVAKGRIAAAQGASRGVGLQRASVEMWTTFPTGKSTPDATFRCRPAAA